VMASWPAPNTKNPQSQGNSLLAMQLVLIIIVVLVVSLRIYTALFLNQSFRIGDWMLIPATVGIPFKALNPALKYEVDILHWPHYRRVFRNNTLWMGKTRMGCTIVNTRNCTSCIFRFRTPRHVELKFNKIIFMLFLHPTNTLCG
jgi:hypothetical protein